MSKSTTTKTQTQTDELAIGIAAAVSGGYEIAADGAVNLRDLSTVVSRLDVVQNAIEGIGQVGDELALATIDDKAGRRAKTDQELSRGGVVNEDDAYDIGSLLNGVLDAVSMVSRKTRKEQTLVNAKVLQEKLSAGTFALTADATVDLDFCLDLLEE